MFSKKGNNDPKNWKIEGGIKLLYFQLKIKNTCRPKTNVTNSAAMAEQDRGKYT